MESEEIVQRLGALAHQGRFAAFRLLVRAGRDGLAAGDIARTLAIAPNTLTSQLAILSAAGLVSATRAGRSIRYAANYAALGGLVRSLVEGCCTGAPEAQAAVGEALSRTPSPLPTGDTP